MTVSISRPVAVVTGAGSGFGAATAETLASKGFDVVVADISEQGATVAKKICAASSIGRAIYVQTDVTRRESWEALAAATLAEFGRISCLVNNAGATYRSKPVYETTEADFNKCMDVNVKSIFHSVHTIFPHLTKEEKSCVINIASTGGVRPRPGLTWYSASKAACISVTQSLAIEFAESHLRVNAILPVLGTTPLMIEFMGGDAPEQIAAYAKTVPLQRFADPQDIANAVAFLASDDASFITGISMPVDGGRLA